MNLLDMILGSNGGENVRVASRRAGIDDNQAKGALEAMLPALLSGLKKNTSAAGGVDSLLGALTRGGHDRYLDDPRQLDDDATVADGNGILGHLLGSKDVSRNVAGHAAQQTGLDVGALKKFLPLVATMAMGAMSKAKKGDSGAAGNPLGFLGGMLDSDGDGSIGDDLLGLAKKFF